MAVRDDRIDLDPSAISHRSDRPGHGCHALPRSHPSLVITAALLAWGLAPPGLAPGWSGRVREAMRGRPPERGRHRTDGARLLRDPDRRRAVGSTRSPRRSPTRRRPTSARSTVPVADVREYVLKPEPRDPPSGGDLDDQRPGDARPRLSHRQARRHLSDRPGGRLDRRGLGRGRRPGVRADLGANAQPAIGRGRDLEPRRPRPRPRPALGAFHVAKGGRSNPDLVVFQGTPADFGWDDRKLRSLCSRKGSAGTSLPIKKGWPIAEARPGGDEESYKKALRPHREAILAGVYRTVVGRLPIEGGRRASGCSCPGSASRPPPADRARLVDLARGRGLRPVVDLSDAFDGLDPATLAIGPDDFHPNATGHARLARSARRSLAPNTSIELGPGGDRTMIDPKPTGPTRPSPAS